MLESTFVFLDGIGEATEQRLWREGIDSWDAFLCQPTIPGIPQARKSRYDEELAQAAEELARGNTRFFARRLKARDHWRLYETFEPTTAFLDIETNGEPAASGHVTLVGLWSGGNMTTLIHGSSLTQARMEEELARYDLLVTFFGSGFDLPYLRTCYPRLALDHAHFDVCFAARRLGYTGGLKHLETEFALPRPDDIDGLSGWDAVTLWHAWCQGDHGAGQRLIQYNEMDVRNLQPLATAIVEELKTKYDLPQRTTSLISNPG